MPGRVYYVYTWNLQFVSKKRLEDTLSQLMFSEEEDRDVLIRIHTAIHTVEEAVDLAAFIKGIIPNAQILGTSTSAVICEGKLLHDQCIISITQMDRIGLKNAAMYLYRKPIPYSDGDAVRLPDTMQLRCVLRNGELFTIPADREECPVAEIYVRNELPAEKLGYVSYPLFCGRYLFGMLVCGADERLFEIGEFLSFQLSRAIYMNRIDTP